MPEKILELIEAVCRQTMSAAVSTLRHPNIARSGGFNGYEIRLETINRLDKRGKTRFVQAVFTPIKKTIDYTEQICVNKGFSTGLLRLIA